MSISISAHDCTEVLLEPVKELDLPGNEVFYTTKLIVKGKKGVKMSLELFFKDRPMFYSEGLLFSTEAEESS